jgi:hypothetical protein
MSSGQQIVWGCIVHEPDAKDLLNHLNALAFLSKQPDKLVVIDNDGCQDVENAVRNFSRTAAVDCEYVDGRPNRGFKSNLSRPYRAWGYPSTPLIFLAAAVALTVNLWMVRKRTAPTVWTGV